MQLPSSSRSQRKMSSEICDILCSSWRRLTPPSSPTTESSRNWQSMYSSIFTSSIANPKYYNTRPYTHLYSTLTACPPGVTIQKGSSIAGPVVPAVVVVEVEVLALHGVLEHVLEVGVVGLLLELQVAAVGEERPELVGQRLAELVDGDRQLLLHDLLVLLLLGVGLQVLPGDRPLHEVEQHVGDALDVVPAALLDPQMRIQRGEASSSRQVLVVLIGDMGVILELVLLGQSEVDHVDLAGLLAVAGHEVVRLHIAVDELALVDVLDALEHLVADHQRGLEVVLLAGDVEEVLQRLPAEVHHHHVVLALRAHVVDVGEARVDGGVVLQPAQDLGLVEELRALGGGLLQLDRVLGVVFDVERHEDLAERPRAQLLGELVVLRHDAVHKLYKELYARKEEARQDGQYHPNAPDRTPRRHLI